MVKSQISSLAYALQYVDSVSKPRRVEEMITINHGRRAVLRGHPKGLPDAIRPPWAQTDFLARCTRCDACVAACETQILLRGDGGYPAVDFSRGECTFCGACVAACDSAALQSSETPWGLQAHTQDNCLSQRGVMCRACAESCEQQALHFRLQAGGRAIPHIDSQLCNGCGACLAVCPENAIRMEEAA